MKHLFSRRKKSRPPVHTVCRNCGMQLQGRYCHQCGQDLFAGAHRSVKGLITNALENIFSLDNKIFVTLKYLLFYPGKLTIEYTRGRVVSYVHPSKLFWFISIVFFATMVPQINWKQDMMTTKEKNIVIAKLDAEIQALESDSSQTDFAGKDEIKRSISQIKQNIQNETKEDDEDLEIADKISLIQTHFSKYAPFLALALVPFFAFLLFVLFHKQQKMYVDHLVFALHIHSFIFLFYALLLLIKQIPHIPQFYSSDWVVFFIPLLYVTIASYIFYRPKILALIWKILLLNILYFSSLLCIFVLLLVLYFG
jgi:hypothetical protein